MLEMNTAKVARVIALVRENGPDDAHLHNYIGSLNADEKASLVALMWVGRDSFTADEFDDAKCLAFDEKTAPTANYLSGIPELAELLEGGLDRLGIDVTEVEALL